ncbi:hypothetical protein VZT92_027865 [Zoarces viviparus]|uniref:Ig-like domain-containing protein n=1 Tax=Zoarces viviparus TaxID=48416 RepID=A0AAW1DW85_ZOAVI
MTGLTGPTVLLMVALCASSPQEDNDTVEVRYPQSSIAPARGSSVKLSCDAIYNVKLCGLLRVAWYSLNTQSAEPTKLTEPGKYFTTVNETEHNVRRRQVVTEIFDLMPKDDGQYQCTAECETGPTAMGHYISITVRG